MNVRDKIILESDTNGFIRSYLTKAILKLVVKNEALSSYNNSFTYVDRIEKISSNIQIKRQGIIDSLSEKHINLLILLFKDLTFQLKAY